MRDSIRRLMVCGVSFAVAACASGGGSGPDAEPVPAGPPIDQPGGSFVMFYADPSGVRERRTSEEIDRVMIGGATDVTGLPSPNNRHVAVAYQRGDSTHLVMVDGETGASWSVHAAVGRGAYTMAWAGGSDALGVGFRPASGRGAVLIADLAGNVRNVGCSASNQFVAWRANGQVVVQNSRNIYTVDARNCNTLATLPITDKTELRYAHDGSHVTFLRGGTLFLAAYNGANTREVAGPNYRPADVRWSPDNRRIAFELQSQRFANITHIGIYDVSSGRATFNAEERALGVPRDVDACWSPRGDRLAWDRFYQRRGADGEPYLQKQVVVRPAGTPDETVLLEELIRGTPRSTVSCRWLDGTHLALDTNEGEQIVNADTRAAYLMPEGSRVLYARATPR